MPSLTTSPALPLAGTPPAGKPLRILYADDMKDLREIARLSLTREGHMIECVADGRLALEKISTDPAAFDVVITDHHMPNLNGLELVTALRAQSFMGKILVFSSELSRQTAQAYQALHVDRILFKPVFPSELRQVMAELSSAPAPSPNASAVAAYA